MLNKNINLTTKTYPNFDPTNHNPESYYLLRLSSLWGDELLDEYMAAIENEDESRIDSEQVSNIPTTNSDLINLKLDSILL